MWHQTGAWNYLHTNIRLIVYHVYKIIITLPFREMSDWKPKVRRMCAQSYFAWYNLKESCYRIPTLFLFRFMSVVVMAADLYMMTSANGNIFRVTGLLCGEFIGHRWLPGTKANDGELWCFLWFAHWINNRDTGDLIGRRAHNDVIEINLHFHMSTRYKNDYHRNSWIDIVLSYFLHWIFWYHHNLLILGNGKPLRISEFRIQWCYLQFITDDSWRFVKEALMNLSYN